MEDAPVGDCEAVEDYFNSFGWAVEGESVCSNREGGSGDGLLAGRNGNDGCGIQECGPRRNRAKTQGVSTCGEGAGNLERSSRKSSGSHD
jgi:hypothetical protein